MTDTHKRLSATSNWNGQPLALGTGQTLKVPQTANATSVLATVQLAKSNNPTVLIVSGGRQIVQVPVPPPSGLPQLLVANWRGNALTIENTLMTSAVVRVQLTGLGLPGANPAPLTVSGEPLSLKPGQSAQGSSLPQWVQLFFQADSPRLTVVAIIGGPPDDSGNNEHVIALNAPRDTGPGTGAQPTMGFHATTTAHYYTYAFNWGAASVFVENLSMELGGSVNVAMRRL